MQVDRRPGDLLEVAPHEPVETAPVLCGSVPVVGPAGAHARKRRVLHHQLAPEAVARQCRPASAGSFRNAAPQSRAGLESVDDRLVDLDVVLDEDQVFTFGPQAGQECVIGEVRGRHVDVLGVRGATVERGPRPPGALSCTARRRASARPVVASSRGRAACTSAARASACGIRRTCRSQGGAARTRPGRQDSRSSVSRRFRETARARGTATITATTRAARARHGDGRGATAVMPYPRSRGEGTAARGDHGDCSGCRLPQNRQRRVAGSYRCLQRARARASRAAMAARRRTR